MRRALHRRASWLQSLNRIGDFLRTSAAAGDIPIEGAPAIYPQTRRFGDYASWVDPGKPAEECQAIRRVITQQENQMGVVTNLRNAAVAISVLEGARDACNNLKPMAMYMTDQELRERAEVVAHVIRARAKLQLLRDRAERLKGDLARFMVRRQAMRE